MNEALDSFKSKKEFDSLLLDLVKYVLLEGGIHYSLPGKDVEIYIVIITNASDYHVVKESA